MTFDRFSEIWPFSWNLLFSTWNVQSTYTTFPGHLERRTRTVQLQIKDIHVQQFMLDILQQTACPYTSRKCDKSGIKVRRVDSHNLTIYLYVVDKQRKNFNYLFYS